MSRSKKTTTKATDSDSKAAEPSPAVSQNVRETIESVVIAFVLAFLFRTFEAEAFVIPTGSMAPTLRGWHKDVECPQCGHGYQVSASTEQDEETQRLAARATNPNIDNRHRERLIREWQSRDVVGGTCPLCRYPLAMRSDSVARGDPAYPEEVQRSYNGDRILVSKFIYETDEPNRWDVVVFKFPGDGKMNYIKRLIGLPNETIRIFQGDIFVRPTDDANADFTIARKPPDKVRALRQLVHDTDHDPASLYRAGWPLRWHPAQDSDWLEQHQGDDTRVSQDYSLDCQDAEVHWLEYQHVIPDYRHWRQWQETTAAGDSETPFQFSDAELAAVRPQLIADLYAYNTQLLRREQFRSQSLAALDGRLGLHWVGDLIAECDIDIESADGEILLQLVEGGQEFTCRIDIASGEASLEINGLADFAPRGKTTIGGAGSHQITFANVDDQLILWVDDRVVDFGDATYDADRVFGERVNIRPRSSPDEPGDLAPIRIGGRNAKLNLSRCRIFRDKYYIADAHVAGPRQLITDYDRRFPPIAQLDLDRSRHDTMNQFLADPSQWDVFAKRRSHDYELNDDQFFVLGDNSPASKDGRLWQPEHEHYVERKLMIGKALFVYWPHSWNEIPWVGVPLPFFPNFSDMRLVR